jgi:electron transfer flavoprotein alpha subunit
MSVLVLVENIEGNFKKKSFELVQYASTIAQKMGTHATALVLGTSNNEAMASLGAYGASKVLNVADAQLNQLSARAYTKAIVAAAEKEGAKVIIASHDTIGKTVAPQVSARIKAGFAGGAVSYPDMSNGFVVKRNVFGGKAFAFVNISTEIKILTLMPNSFPVVKGEGVANLETLAVTFDSKDFAMQVKETNKVTGSVPLGEAELVVSGGRGLKGPENWGVIVLPLLVPVL